MGKSNFEPSLRGRLTGANAGPLLWGFVWPARANL
jgi:hypothetical protein